MVKNGRCGYDICRGKRFGQIRLLLLSFSTEEVLVWL
jgi:hypothetical protein